MRSRVSGASMFIIIFKVETSAGGTYNERKYVSMTGKEHNFMTIRVVKAQ